MQASEQMGLWSRGEARGARDEALERVEQGRSRDWFGECLAAILETAEVLGVGREGFTTDDVLKRHPELEDLPEPRILGAAVRRLSDRAGGHADLYSNGEYRTSDRVKSHGRPKRVWYLEIPF